MQSSVLESIIACPRLPSLPAVALEVLELTRHHDIDLRALARIIQKDQALASKVLRTINSSFYGLSRPCGTIQQALVYLGVNTVRTLVLGFSLVDCINGVDDVVFDYMTYWKRGLYAAVTARQIALEHRRAEPDEAFLAGLIQDIGMIALYRHFGDRYLQIMDMTDGDDRLLPRLEREAFDVDHAQVGYELARKWKLPPQIAETIRHHHTIDPLESPHVEIVRTIHLANAVALILTLPHSDGMVRWLARQSGAWFGLGGEAVQRLLAQATQQVSELASLFRLKVGNAGEAGAILAQAEERLVEFHFELERERQMLLQQNEDLSRQNMTDPLTGVANRKRFDQYLRSHFERAQAQDGLISVIFCDVDHFKPVNDTHGHQVGDAVLQELAARMENAVGSDGLVARSGGEEFAIILPNADRVAATTLAEALRLAVEAAPIPLRGFPLAPESLPITISLGVASLEPHLMSVVVRPGLLLRLADQAVYAAKEAGRNCVRVFTSRRDAPPSSQAA